MKNPKIKRRSLRYHRWARYIPTQESILTYRALKPVRRFLDHPSLWHFNRQSVAGGTAVGLFFSVAFPVAQIPLAAIAAILFKVNLPIAVFGTLLSNPFTTPALLFLAFQLGTFLIGYDVSQASAVATTPATLFDPGHFGSVLEWLRHLFAWIESAGWPLVVGLGALSVLLSLAGYISVRVAWRIQAASRWRTRHTERQRKRIN